MTAQRAFRSDRILVLSRRGEAESSRKVFASFVVQKKDLVLYRKNILKR
jgi:hypothetical protein